MAISDSGGRSTPGRRQPLTEAIYPVAKTTRMVLPRRLRDLPATLTEAWRKIRQSMHPSVPPQDPEVAEPTRPEDLPNWDVEPDGIGICFSGGGIRSASYCLGALQAMGEAGMLFGDRTTNPNRAKYLSAVSGGSYIATALTLVTKGPVDGANEFGDESITPTTTDPAGSPDMRPFAPGTPEEQFIRHHTLYLTEAKGGIPGTIWRAILGLLLNVLLAAWIVGTLALPLGWLYGWAWTGLRADCPKACSFGGSWSVPGELWLAVAAAGTVAVFVGFLWISLRFTQDWKRTMAGSISGVLLAITAGLLLFAIAVPAVIHLARPAQAMASTAGTTKNATVAGSAVGLVALVLTWVAASRQILSNASGVEKLAIDTAKNEISKYRTLAFKVVAFLGGPILLFSVILIVAFYGSGFPPGASGSNGLTALAIWGSATVVLALIWRRADVTTWSLYPFYRRRLSAAFVIGRIRRADPNAPSPTAVGRDDATERPYAAQYNISDCQPANLPELLICASANISDKNVTPAGSRVTSFVFSKDWIGGPLVGAVRSTEYRDATAGRPSSRTGRGSAQGQFTTLPTAMALSGAAFAPSMGRMTKSWLRVYMVLANLRLGVWVPNPRRMSDFAAVGARLGRKLLPRPDYLVREILGRNHLDAPFLYVTDGGHYENLGLVELLRRKCKTIWCLDASGDQIDTFNTIGEAFRTAESELGVSFSHDPKADMAPTTTQPPAGQPWFVKSTFCGNTFKYDDDTQGVLVIVKAGVPNGAPWSIRSYQAEHAHFPCDPTMDQLFDGERFDAYRSLGRFSVTQALKGFSPNGEKLPAPKPVEATPPRAAGVA
jgi:hypothetical protein